MVELTRLISNVLKLPSKLSVGLRLRQNQCFPLKALIYLLSAHLPSPVVLIWRLILLVHWMVACMIVGVLEPIVTEVILILSGERGHRLVVSLQLGSINASSRR